MLHHLKDHVSVTAHPPSRAQGTPFETRLSECILSSMHEGAGPFVRFKLSYIYILFIYIYISKQKDGGVPHSVADPSLPYGYPGS